MKNLPPAIKRERLRVQVHFTKPTLTKQSFGPECNINNILARYRTTGVVEHINNRTPVFGDFTEIPDYQTALDIVYTAEDAFLQLPSQVRKFFNNDPSFMLAYMQDPKNLDTCQKLGLITKTEVAKKPSGNSAAEKTDEPATSTTPKP